MSKPCMLNYGDGLRETHVGDLVFIVKSDRRSKTGSYEKIVKIGRLLVTVGDPAHTWSNEQYYIATGRLKSEYGHARLFSSMEAYETFLEQSEFIVSVQNRLHAHVPVISYDQAVRIKAILDEVKK